MKRAVITLTLAASMAFPGSEADANDLIKALAALRRAGRRYDVSSPRGFDHAPGRRDVILDSSAFRRSLTSRSSTLDITAEAARLRAIERAEYLRRMQRIAELERLQRLEQAELARRRATVTHRVPYQEPLPVPPPTGLPALPSRHPGFIPAAPTLPAPGIGRPGPPVPGIPGPAPRHHHADFAFGDIVDCPVPLYTRLRIRDRHNIACGARPMVVAVKAPGACDHACSCCADEIVFVQVMAPPCEPKWVKVSPCGRHVRMDFGKYEIDIVSMSNLVKVDYDN